MDDPPREITPISAHDPPESDPLSILILAPTSNDARLSGRFLEKAGFATVICATVNDLAERLRAGCGALLLAEEAVAAETVGKLVEALTRQPSWSDLPLILITAAGEAAHVRPRYLAALSPLGNISIIERPVRPETLVSTCEVALRSRRRQYQVRDLLAERDALVSKAQEQAQVFDTTLSSIADFAYIFDRDGRFLYANKSLLDLWGLKLDEAIGKNFFDLAYPDELAKKLEQQIRRVFEFGEIVRDETPYTSPTGVVGYYEYIFSPVFGNDNTVTVVAGSTRDTSERRRSEEALREADRRKDEFLAMLAHELRNPLAAVASAASLITSSTEDREWAAGVISRQSSQLAHLIDDLLNVSRITTGKIRLRKEIVDAATILDRARDSAQPLISSRKHELICNYAAGFLWVEADPTRLEQIALNLLTNAAKYTPAGGRIELFARLSNAEILITVRDNGIGIAPHRMPEMFQLFAQGERSIARSEGGLGIGLTIVQKLVDMHGGRIEAQSDGPNFGSSFTVCFPVATVSASTKSGENAVTAPGAPGRRILIVDDNIDTAQSLARLLTRAGHEVVLAHDGLKAVELAREQAPHAVVLDIGLPGMDGFEVVQRLRGEACCADAVIIAVTGYGQPEDRQRALEAGFDHHLVKPVDLDELRSLLQQQAVRRGVVVTLPKAK